MKPPPFDYRVVHSLDEAVRALAEGGGEVKLVAGGQSLMPMLNFRLLAPARLIDINAMSGLDEIGEDGPGGLRIGALARHRALEISPLIAVRFPIVAAAMRQVAHLAIRNRGTIGGSLAHADPAAELPMLALLLDARVETAAPEGRRVIAARDFFRGALTTALGEAEMIAGVVLPTLPHPCGWGFEEVARRRGDFAIVAVGAILIVEEGRCRDARIALAGVGERPVRAAAAEALLLGQAADASVIAAAAGAARDVAEPGSDLHASADFRRHLVEVLTRRALESAWHRASSTTGIKDPLPPLPGKEGRVRGVASLTHSVAPLTPPFPPAGGGEGVRNGRRRIRATVNGVEYDRTVEPRLLLVDFLRDELGLTGTHVGCEHGVCGACTVLVEGDSARACLMLAVQADGKRVETIEGLGTVEALHPVQQAFREHHALQCGFCTPGMVMTTVDLLRKRRLANDEDIRDGLSGNLCRCTGYQHIVAAVRALAAAREGGDDD